jgi:PAS domain S-box-containing protein
VDLQTRAIVELAFDAFIEVDPAGIIVEWSGRAEKTFGWSADEAVGQASNIIVPARHAHAYDADLRGFLAQGKELALEKPLPIRAIHRDGREFAAELGVACAQRGGLIAFVRDLSESRRLEDAVRESAEYRSILNAVEDGYSEVDLNGTFLFVNDAYCRMFNRTREEVFGRTPLPGSG